MIIQQKTGPYFFLFCLVAQQVIAISCAIYAFYMAQAMQVFFYMAVASCLSIALATHCIFKRHNAAQNLLLATLILGFLFILVSSSDQVSSIWCLATAPVIGATLGHRLGVIVLIAIFLTAVAILLSGILPYINLKYDGIMILRFLFSYIVLAMFSITMENSNFTDLRQRINTSPQLRETALRDALTNLPNRPFMEERLKLRYRYYELNKHVFSIVLADLDRCKSINDQYGQNAGDLALKKIGALLEEELREDDIAARWSGDQFLLLLPNIPQDVAIKIAERLRIKASQLELETQGEKLNITLSIGVASAEQSLELNDLLSCIENCVYQAKQMGRNIVIAA